MAWRVRTLNATVDRELDALPADMRARFRSHRQIDRYSRP